MPITPDSWDWERARAMYFGGFTTAQITHASGVTPEALGQRARRQGWRKLRAELAATLLAPYPKGQTIVPEVPTRPPISSRDGLAEFTGDARDRSHQFQAALQTELQRGVQAISKLPLNDPKDIREWSRILDGLITGWKTVYTLGADNGHVAELVDLARVRETELNISTVVRNPDETPCPSTG